MRWLFALLTAAAFAQQPPANQPKPGRIEGIVISISGEPVARAQVRYNSAVAASDDAGKFVLENVSPSRAVITAEKAGFLTGSFSRASANAPLTLAPGETIKGLTITMTPGGAISGLVTDQNKDPLVGIRVQLLRRGYRRGVAQLLTVDMQQTNDVGEYRFANVSPGRYVLVAVRARQADLAGDAASPIGPLSTFYPNSPDPKGAIPLELVAGQQRTGVDIRMLEGAVFSVRGKMLSQSRALPSPIQMGTIPEPYPLLPLEHIYKVAPSRSDGSFDLRYLPAGRYTLYAVRATESPRVLGFMPLDIPKEDVVDLVFPLNGGVSITGSILAEEGDLASVMPSNSRASGARPRIAIGLEDTHVSFGLAPLTEAATDGSFTIRDAAPLAYGLTILGMPPGVYVKEATLGGLDALHNVIDLARGGGELRIVLAKGAGGVAGSVKKEKDDETAGVYVSLWPEIPEPGANNQGVVATVTDQNGAFTFTGLRPGKYFIAAWEEIDRGLAQTPPFLALMESDAVKIDLGKGATLTAEVRLIPKSKINAAEEKLP
jgi:uncharacterized protein (DUF2141 family)